MEINKIAAFAHFSADKRGILKKYKTHEELKNATFQKITEENCEFLTSEPVNHFDKDSEQSEIADIILTLFTYCHESGYDVEKLIKEKLEYNMERED